MQPLRIHVKGKATVQVGKAQVETSGCVPLPYSQLISAIHSFVHCAGRWNEQHPVVLSPLPWCVQACTMYAWASEGIPAVRAPVGALFGQRALSGE